MKITMIGTGYVGLVSGTCLSELGHHVTCMDKDRAKIAMLEQGRIPIYEPGLEARVEKNVKEERLRFTADLADAMEGARAVFI
ncbi:MAG: UDP-glucose 6-dehydrogenase, partial [Deltaproteobacteria bacterium]